MKRLLIIGNSPLPTENTKFRPAAGLRTHQFLKPLIKEGGTGIENASRAFSSKKRASYKVTLISISMPECYEKDPGYKEVTHSDHFSHISISKNDRGLVGKIQKIYDDFHPDAILSINTYPSYVAAQLETHAPLWADLNGWVMAEAQAQAFKMESNDYLPHYFQMERTIMKRADKFSAVSVPEKFALYGELGALGRLNSETFNYEFVHSIPNGTEWFAGEADVGAGGDEDVVAGGDGADGAADSSVDFVGEKVKKMFSSVPNDAFVALWLGGYNTWVDEVTLFKGIEAAMAKNDRFYFVSTGGGLEGLDNKTFSHFKKMIAGSEYKDRFIFLGWVDTQDIPHIYKRVNIGLNVDRRCVETSTGARNRINEMMKFGVPVVTTLGSEISYEVVRVEAGVGVMSGKHDDLTYALNHMYEDWKRRRGLKLAEYGENGRNYIADECGYDGLIEPVVAWLDNPRPAPDRGVRVSLSGGVLRSALLYLRNNGLKKFLNKVRQKVGL